MNFTLPEVAKDLVRVEIHLRHDKSGDIAVYHDTAGRTWTPSEVDSMFQYQWGEGNCSCDHNRVLFFMSAKNGKWPSFDEAEAAYPEAQGCDAKEFSVMIVRSGTEQIIYADGFYDKAETK